MFYISEKDTLWDWNLFVIINLFEQLTVYLIL